MKPIFVGVDVGTSAAKAAAFDERGVAVRASRRSMPALRTAGPRAWQDVDGVVAAAEGTLRDLDAPGARGEAVESDATLPRHPRGAELERVRATIGGRARLPGTVPVGAEAGIRAGVPLHVTAGDKNCEYLGAGVRSAGVGAVSLGSAISLGVLACADSPAPAAGTVARGMREGRGRPGGAIRPAIRTTPLPATAERTPRVRIRRRKA